MATQTMNRQSAGANQPRNATKGQTENRENENRELTGEDFYDLVNEVSDAVQRYCVARPGVAAGVIFGVGFMLGWKLRPW